MATGEAAPVNSNSCNRCENAATAKIRGETVCRDCYCRYIITKTVKRLEVLDRETRSSRRPTKRKYLVGLSFGPSSSALVNICNQVISNQVAKNRNEPFSLHVVHISMGLDAHDSSDSFRTALLLDKWRPRYTRFTFETIPLSSVLKTSTVDWSALPPLKSNAEPEEQLGDLLSNLPSTTSKSDMVRLFVRHILISHMIQTSHDALLLGCSTTALAELTLSEVAKGRGFSLPWQIQDGQLPVPDYSGQSASDQEGTRSIPLYYPLRDLYRREIVHYGLLLDPPITELILPDREKESSVVSHKDLSIEEVTVRYFQTVEENYPSIVTNVVRTTGKLDRLDEAGRCGVCGMALDQQGDERWRGELGEARDATATVTSLGRRCYGCERSIRG